MKFLIVRPLLVLLSLCLASLVLAVPPVGLLRVPNGGIQPQAVRDANGTVHLVYYSGDPAHGDLFYSHSTDDGITWSAPVQVNGTKGDAIALGNIRGAQIAIGRSGIVHVAWIGSKVVPGQPSDGGLSVLYTHSKADGSFEPERNLQGGTTNIDGGDTVAADENGNVYVIWHAAQRKTDEEKDRKLWVAQSIDDGKTFAPEHPAWNEPTGACGCCSTKAMVGAGKLWVAYRGAQNNVMRDPFLIWSSDQGRSFFGYKSSDWLTNQCPMSTFSLFDFHGKVFEAWERKGVIQWSAMRGEPSRGVGANAKYPVVVVNGDGETLVAWTEGMGYQRGGALAWQVYDRNGKAVPSQRGRQEGVPANSLISAWARKDGSFAIMY